LVSALDFRRGQYEPARKELSQFFASLNAAVGPKSNVSDFTPEQLKSFQAMFSERDELMTLLARNNPTSADRLDALYLTLRKTLA
jgi:hypothetical protein